MLSKTHAKLFFKLKKRPSFWSSLLNANNDLLYKIYTHPFNQQLLIGTLPSPIFGHYLRDDYYYLQQFSLVLQTLSKRSLNVNDDLANHLTYLAKDIISNEHEMQRMYSSKHYSDTSQLKTGSVILAYSKYLRQSVNDTVLPVALSSALPCFWIYKELGALQTDPVQLKENPYKEWIATYSTPEFITATKLLIETVDILGKQASLEVQIKMQEAFKKGVTFELEFLDEIWSHHIVKTQSLEA